MLTMAESFNGLHMHKQESYMYWSTGPAGSADRSRARPGLGSSSTKDARTDLLTQGRLIIQHCCIWLSSDKL